MQIGSEIVEIEEGGESSNLEPWSVFNSEKRRKISLASPVAKAWFLTNSETLKSIEFTNDESWSEDDAYILLNNFEGHPYIHQSAGATSYFGKLLNPSSALQAVDSLQSWHQLPLFSGFFPFNY